jgi:hypothetical protein
MPNVAHFPVDLLATIVVARLSMSIVTCPELWELQEYCFSATIASGTADVEADIV